MKASQTAEPASGQTKATYGKGSRAPKSLIPANNDEAIVIRGARVHNLKNISTVDPARQAHGAHGPFGFRKIVARL